MLVTPTTRLLYAHRRRYLWADYVVVFISSTARNRVNHGQSLVGGLGALGASKEIL